MNIISTNLLGSSFSYNILEVRSNFYIFRIKTIIIWLFWCIINRFLKKAEYFGIACCTLFSWLIHEIVVGLVHWDTKTRKPIQCLVLFTEFLITQNITCPTAYNTIYTLVSFNRDSNNTKYYLSHCLVHGTHIILYIQYSSIF